MVASGAHQKCSNLTHFTFLRHQDVHNQAFYMVLSSSRWFSVRSDLLGVPFIACVALASVAFSMDPG